MLLDESTDKLFQGLDVEQVHCYLVLADLQLLMEDWVEFVKRSRGG